MAAAAATGGSLDVIRSNKIARAERADQAAHVPSRGEKQSVSWIPSLRSLLEHSKWFSSLIAFWDRVKFHCTLSTPTQKSRSQIKARL